MNELKSEISNILLLMVQEFRKNSEVNLMEYTRLLLSLPSLVEIIRDAEKIRKANEYLEGLDGIEINDINGMVAVFNALSTIVRTGEGEG